MVNVEEEIRELHENVGSLAQTVDHLRAEVSSLKTALEDAHKLCGALNTELNYAAASIHELKGDNSVLAQHERILRDKLHAMALIVGALDNTPDGSLRWRVSLLEQSTIMHSVLDLEQLRNGKVALGEALESYKDEPFPQICGDVDTGNPEEA